MLQSTGFLKSKQARRDITILALETALLTFFIVQIPLHRMYGWADSLQYQRMALSIVGKESLAGGYAQFFAPGLPAVVAALYLVTQNIDIASVVANFFFSLGALLVFLRLSRSLKLTALLIFVPYWLIISFSTLADASFILCELTAVALLIGQRYNLSLLVAAVSASFRLEGLFLIGIIFLVLICQRKFRKEFIFYPVLGVAPILAWGEFTFGDPLISLSLQTVHAWNLARIISAVSTQMSLGFVGVAKLGYVVLTLVASVITILMAWRKFGLYHVFFVLSLVFTVLHTVLSPVHIFPDMARLYLYVAPVTLLVFRKFMERRFLPLLLVLAPLGMFVAYIFWTVTFSTPFI